MTGFKRYFFLILTLFAFACQRRAELRTIPVNDFFKSQDKIGYRLSPDGKNLSYLRLQGEDRNIYIEDIATGEGKNITRLKGKNIGFYFWVSNDELVYYKDIDAGSSQSDMYIVDKEGNNERQLISNEKIS